MIKLFFTVLVFFIAQPALAATDDKAADNSVYVEKAEKWLSDLQMATADFRQIDYQGRELRGKFYISRPGRLRFEYEAPIKDHIVADGTFIYFHDGETDQASSAPIGATLADFILRGNVDMDDKMKIESVRTRDNMVQITISQRDQPGTGELILNYNKSPFSLASWRIIDAQGLTTDIILSGFTYANALDPRLFVYKPAQSQDRFNQ